MKEFHIGGLIPFGGYNWRILDIKDNAALMITDYIIEERPYHDAYQETTWADCALRKYLNDGFYDKFNGTDRSRIISVINKNPDNPWYGSNGGPDTKDRIFILSIEEAVCQYFGDSSSKLYHPGKNQRYWFERKDENNGRRMAKLVGKPGRSWWWLRSPGRVAVKAAYIHGDGRCMGGVRPALWLNLESH